MNMTIAQAYGLLSGAEQINSRGYRDLTEPIPRGPRANHKYPDKQITALLVDGCSPRRIAEDLAIPLRAVYKIKARYGLAGTRSRRCPGR